MYRGKETLQQAPQNKRKDSYGTKCRRSGKDKTTVACCLGEFPEPNGLGARRETGGLPGNRRAPDFRNIQGDSAIPRNTVTSTSCDRRVNRVAGEEGEESHSAEGVPATADRPRADRMKLPLLSRGPLVQERERHYRKGSRTKGEPKEGRREGGSKVPAMCSSTVQADPTRGKREREGSPVTKKYEQGRQRRGHDFSKADRTDRATQERVQYQRAGPPGQLLHR